MCESAPYPDMVAANPAKLTDFLATTRMSRRRSGRQAGRTIGQTSFAR
jgi:hypothetical protein